MVSNCANPKCAKPLHYLREGRIFVFDVATGVPGKNGKLTRRMEHYWLCGMCCQSLTMEQTPDGVRAVPRTVHRFGSDSRLVGSAIAS